MIGVDFIFNNQMLSEYGMQMLDPENEQTWVNREIDKSEITSVRPRPNHYGTHYADTEKLPFLIMRDDEKYGIENMELNRYDINKIRTWLESPKYPTAFELIDDDERKVVYYGIVTDVHPFLVATRCYGIYFTLTCDSPYGYSQPIKNTLSYDSTADVNAMRLHVHSAEENEYIYPKITLELTRGYYGAETVTVTNSNDGFRCMEVSFPYNARKIIIDCQKKLITDGNGNLLPLESILTPEGTATSSPYLSMENNSYYWLRLKPHENNISFSTENDMLNYATIEYQEIIKAGGF